jgi:DNA-binding NtrC family response regulator
MPNLKMLDSKLKKETKESLHKNHSFNLYELLEGLAGEYMQDALILFDGNKTDAAKFLGIKRSTFSEKCKKMGIGQ